MAVILERLSYSGILPFYIITKNSGWMLSNPETFPSLTFLSAIETSSQVKEREYSVSMASDFRVLSSRFTLIICVLFLSAFAVATMGKAVAVEFVLVLSLDMWPCILISSVLS